jgi:hypothetical protein
MDNLLQEVYDYFACEPPEDAIHLIPEITAETLHARTREFHTTPTILVCGDSPDLCSCNELAVLEVLYDRISKYKGKEITKHFREMICAECYSDPEYWNGKIYIDVKEVKIDVI